ncbi:MAG: metallophosphoesterase [Blastocatellia bacterium]
MPEFHAEPFLQLAGLTHKSALIAWGAFYFKVKDSDGKFKLVDDDDLKHVHPPRHQTIGARSEPYGDARVEVLNGAGKIVASASTHTTNFCWLAGLEPDTEYTYRVIVNGEEWGRGERRDWVERNGKMGLNLIGNSYDNRFRTHPDPTQPSPEPLTFAVFGDYGTGIKKKDRPQGKVATVLKKAVDKNNVRLILTTGDNIYAGKKFLGLPVGDEGDEDDDWYFTYYQPYRYIINRVPVYPCIGNHDASESEDKDDRAQVVDNLYLDQRIAGEEAAGRASVDPGLFYRFRYGSEIEFICIDTSKEPDVFKGGRLFQHPKHLEFLKMALPDQGGALNPSPAWRIPFSHHPPFSAGPMHHNTKEMTEIVEMFQRAGVRIAFNGHEHNFQHSRANGIDYFVTGAGGKLRKETPDKFTKAHTVSWCAANHFLLVTIDDKQATVRPIGGVAGSGFSEIKRLNPDGGEVTDSIVIALG